MIFKYLFGVFDVYLSMKLLIVLQVIVKIAVSV